MALGAALVIGACGEFDAPNQNYSTISDLTSSNPSRAAVATAAQGLLGSVAGTNAGLRNFYLGFNQQTLGILGREGYNLDVSNPQNIPTFYQLPAGNAFKNLMIWNAPYATIKQANLVISAVDNVTGASAGEKEGVKGYAQTVKAISLFYVIRGTDVNGAVLDALTNPTDAPPPIADRATTYARILSLLDSGAAHLAAAGSTPFMFTITDGFAPFGTPATFIQFNKGMRAKVDIDQTAVGNPNNAALYTAALADLAASFLDTTKAMNFGAFVTFSTAGTDVVNPMYDPTSRQRYVSTAFAADAQLQNGATVGDTTARDLRFLAKAKPIAPVSRYSFNVNWGLNSAPSNQSPVAVLKNEELILLRAEARLACSGPPPVTCLNTDVAGALADVNTVRVKSGGLAPIVAATATPARNGVTRTTGNALLDEVLYNKRYSLFYENGDRWVDMRRYGNLAALTADDRPGDIVWPNTVIPINECLPRSPQPSGCTNIPTPVAHP
jgi:hypothetical protein